MLPPPARLLQVSNNPASEISPGLPSLCTPSVSLPLSASPKRSFQLIHPLPCDGTELSISSIAKLPSSSLFRACTRSDNMTRCCQEFTSSCVSIPGRVSPILTCPQTGCTVTVAVTNNARIASLFSSLWKNGRSVTMC